jgi:hypothetical protein
MPEKIKDNTPTEFIEKINPTQRCICGGEVIIRVIFTRNVDTDYGELNPVIGQATGAVKTIKPTVEYTAFCEKCSLRYDLVNICRVMGVDLIRNMNKKYAEKFGAKLSSK